MYPREMDTARIKPAIHVMENGTLGHRYVHHTTTTTTTTKTRNESKLTHVTKNQKQDDYPCQGDDTIICCVNYENMTNGSSTSTSSSALPSATGINDDGSSSSQDNGDLTGSQIGGIVGGIVGAVLVTAFIVVGFFWWKRWKAKQAAAAAAAAASDVGSPGTTDAGGGYNYHPLHEIQGKEYHQLESNENERFEMDGHGAALQEMEGESPVQAQREVAELPGCEVKAPR